MIYSLCIIVSILFAIYASRKNEKIAVFFVALILSLLAGLRGIEIGVDTRNYYAYIENVDYIGITFGSDIGFSILCKLILNFVSSPEYVLLILSIITNFLIVFRCWDFKEKASFPIMMAVYITMQYLYSFNIVRQFLAIAIIFYASKFITQGKIYKYIILNFFAASIHTSAVMGFIYLFVLKDIDVRIKRKKNQWKYVTIFLGGVLAIVVANLFGISRYFLNYFTQSIHYSFSLLTIYRISITIFVIITSRGFRNKRFSIDENKNYIGFSKNITIIYLMGLGLCMIGMFFMYMNRIGFYFLIFELPFWGQVCKAKNIYNRRIYMIMLFFMLVYVYLASCTGNEILNYTTFFQNT